jgi:hypothetical protein
MEFKLKDLVDTQKNDIVGHLFLHCIDRDFANVHKFISEEDFNTRTIDITLTIDGQEFDIKPWLEQFKEDYFTYVKRAAQNIVSEKLSNRCEEIAETLNNLKEKLESAESCIDWDEILIKE